MRHDNRLRRHQQPGGFWWVWRIPIALAVLTLVGLLMALLGNGHWASVACVCLSVPVLVCLWFGAPRQRN